MDSGVKKCVILGIGNPFRSDDAVGLLAAEALLHLPPPPGIEVAAPGADPLSAVGHFEGASRVVLIDAVSMGEPPGTIRTFSPDEVRAMRSEGRLDSHAFGLADALDLARALGYGPEVRIVGVQPATFEHGECLSEAVRARMPEILDAALRAATGNGPD